MRAGIFSRAAHALWAVATGMVATFVALTTETEHRPEDERRVHDSDSLGEMNYRTGRLDAGTDPYGWYDDE